MKESTVMIRTYRINTQELMKHFGIKNGEISSIRMGEYREIGKKNPMDIVIETEESIRE